MPCLERYYSLNEDRIKRADCILFVYDITNEESFNLFDNYYRPLIEKHKRSNISIAFCGNKTDNEKERKVPFEKALEFCIENKIFFMETSCKTMKNVNNIFETLISLTLHSIIQKDKKNNDIIIEKIRNLIKKKYSLFSSSKKKDEDYILKELRFMKETNILNNFENLLKKNENQIAIIDNLEKELKEERDNNKILRQSKEEYKKALKDLENEKEIKEKLVKKIEYLENELKEIKKNNRELKEKIEEMNKIIKDKELKINNEEKKFEELNQKMNELKIICDNNANFKKVIELIEEMKEKEREIKDLKNQFPFELLKGEKLISVIFISEREDICWSIICKNTHNFNEVENLFYDRYPEYKEFKLIFLINGLEINKYQSLEKNNIYNGSIINIKY